MRAQITASPEEGREEDGRLHTIAVMSATLFAANITGSALTDLRMRASVDAAQRLYAAVVAGEMRERNTKRRGGS